MAQYSVSSVIQGLLGPTPTRSGSQSMEVSVYLAMRIMEEDDEDHGDHEDDEEDVGGGGRRYNLLHKAFTDSRGLRPVQHLVLLQVLKLRSKSTHCKG